MNRQKYFFLILLMAITLPLVAQDSIQKPSFKGSDKARLEFLQKHIKYPEIAREYGMEGTVYIAFTVMKDGTLDSLEIVRKVGKSLDEEVIRIFKLMPKWQPAMKNNQPITYRDTLPLSFRLAGSDNTLKEIKQWIEKERYRKAYKELKWVEESNTKSTGHIYYYGLVCYKRGKETKGLSYIRKAARMNDFEAKQFLSRYMENDQDF